MEPQEGAPYLQTEVKLKTFLRRKKGAWHTHYKPRPRPKISIFFQLLCEFLQKSAQTSVFLTL